MAGQVLTLQPGGGAAGPADVTAPNYVAIGTNPAQSGALRLANAGAIKARNNGNTADIQAVVVDSFGNVVLGEAGVLVSIPGGGAVSATTQFTMNGTMILSGTGLLQLQERTAPSAPGVDRANLWVQDNGSGKTQVMVQFNTGVPIQLAIQV